MAPTVASFDPYHADSSSPITVSKPAGASNGDVLTFFLGQDAGSALASLTKPGDWGDVGNANAASVQTKCWSHTVSGASPSSWTFGYAGGADVAGGLIRAAGADGTPTITLVSGTAGPNAGSVTNGSIVPNGSDDLCVAGLFVFGAGNTLAYTVPSGFTNIGSAQEGTFQAAAFAYQALSSSSTVAAQTWTGITPGNANGNTITICIKSAGAGASTPAPQPIAAPAWAAIRASTW